ncbi:MAG TPA: glycosyltransferase family 4 protein [Nevskiaceae bacterium]|nr:glycosyltransferase family 4 protein [Nevskiaceae bacterium]
MQIATMVKGYITAPAPKDIVYAPIDLAIQISNGLAKRGHTVDFYAPQGSHLSPAKVVTLGLKPLVKNYHEFHDALIDPAYHSDNVLATWDQRLAGEMFKRAARGEYDLLHFHHPEVALPFVSIYPDVPVAYTMHDPISPLQRRMLKMYETPSQHLVTISDKQRETAPDLNYIATIYNGIDTKHFAPGPGKRSEDLLFLGSILPHKGAKEAVEVARQTNSGLVIVGPTYPDHIDYFQKHIAPYLNEKIRYMDHIAHHKTLAYFQNAKAFLMPIQWEEPFGLTMVEAMACGTPVIAFKRGSAAEIVTHNKTGFVVGSVHEMAQAVGRVGSIDPATCRATALKRFSTQTMIEGYEQVFSGILAKN